MLPKFRAWHKELKLMRDVMAITFTFKYVDVFESGQNYNHWYFENIELMQWTGLKDRSGKDIYEGDIVKYQDWPPKVIKYGTDTLMPASFAGWVLNDTLKYLMLYDEPELEVIGNIYQHPELLEVKE